MVDTRCLSPDEQEVLRRRAVKLVLGGASQAEAAREVGVSKQSVCAWMKRHRDGGGAALASGKRGPRVGALRPWQAAQIAKAVIDHHPEQLKLPFYLWTRQGVQQLIRERFDIEVSVWTVGRYLARWGFSPQKPARRALEQDPVAVQAWLDREYPAIEKQAKAEKAVIYWGDEMGMRSDDAVGRTWAKRGETPVVPVSGRRFGCNMISAITNRGELAFMVFPDQFTVPVFLRFLGRLIKHAPSKAFLIVDGHPVHRSGKVRSWVERNVERLRLFFLPAYSPELNPDEVLNNDVKTNAIRRRPARSKLQMMSTARSYLRSTQRRPAIVRNYFRESHVRYAAG